MAKSPEDDVALTGAAPQERQAAVPAPASYEAEFAAFYREQMPRLVTFLLYQGAREEAADLAQNTMIEAFREWPRIRHRKAWTRKVAGRALVRHLSRIYEEPVEDVPEPSPVLSRHEDLDELVNGLRLRHVILRLVAGLPWRQRQVLAWTLDEFTPAEIAEELQITPEAVRSTLMKARRAIAGQLPRGEGSQ